MPARYDYTNRAYRISCTVCDEHVLAASLDRNETIQGGTFTSDEAAIGSLVSEWIGWHSGHGRWVTRCRSCTRAAQRARRGSTPRAPRNSARVPGSFRRLGVGRRYGVELEVIFPSGWTRERINSALVAGGLSGWRCKSDGSLSAGQLRFPDGMRGQGWEIVSPVLEGEDGIDQIRRACRVLRDAGVKVNTSCGLHVHHEIRDLTVEMVKRFVRTWSDNQDTIDGLVSQSRRNNTGYCRRLSTNEVENIEGIQTLNQLSYATDRYRALNVTAYGRYGTIEIRQHQGTADAEKVISWVRMGQAMIEAAAEAPAAITRTTRIRELMTALGEHMDETARTFLLGRAVEFGAVAV